jgi:hypothetical protein
VNLNFLFSGLIQLYYLWEALVLFSTFGVVLNSFYSIVSKKKINLFDIRITTLTLVFNLLFFIIGIIIYLTNVLFFNIENEYLFEKDNNIFYLNEHLINLISLIIIAIGWSLHKKSNIDLKIFLRFFIFYFFGLVILTAKYLYLN